MLLSHSQKSAKEITAISTMNRLRGISAKSSPACVFSDSSHFLLSVLLVLYFKGWMQFAGSVTRGQHKAIQEMRRSGSALDVFKFHALYISPINVIAIRDFVDFILQTTVPSVGGWGGRQQELMGSHGAVTQQLNFHCVFRYYTLRILDSS